MTSLAAGGMTGAVSISAFTLRDDTFRRDEFLSRRGSARAVCLESRYDRAAITERANY